MKGTTIARVLGRVERGGSAAVEERWWSTNRAFAILLTIALTALGALAVARMIALFPLEHDVTAENSLGDDWLLYHQYALSVLNDGLTMPIVDGAYRRPAGFGYVYFLASIYAIAGVKSEAVYFVQGLLLVAGIAGMYAVFRRQLSSRAALVFLGALAVLMYVDVYRALAFRLLAENLLFPLLPVLLFFWMKGHATGKLPYFAAGGVVCGLCFLARPNLLLFGPAAAAVVLLFKSPHSLGWRTRAAVTLLAASGATASLLPLRNYAVTGRANVTSVTSQADWSGRRLRSPEFTWAERVGILTWRSIRRGVYVIGFPQLLRPAFRIKPHWFVMWSAFAWYLYTLVFRKTQFWEILVLALAVSYFVPMFAFGDIGSYGSRMLIPGLPLILVLAVRGLDGLLPSLRPRPA